MAQEGRQSPPFAAYTGAGPVVFVSYSHADAHQVYPELVRLRDAGFDIWYDEGISPGHNWPEELANAIERCAVFLLFVSPRSVGSSNCVRETNFALSRNKPVVAVHLEETELPRGLELSLGDTQGIHAYRLKPDDYTRKLETALAEYTGTRWDRPPSAAQVAAPPPAATPASAGPGRWIIALVVAAVIAWLVWLGEITPDQEPRPQPPAPPGASAEPVPDAVLADLIDTGDSFSAFLGLRENPALAETLEPARLQRIQLAGTVLSQPSGARVAIRPLGSLVDTWLELGTTPLTDVPLPKGDYQIRFRLDGHHERIHFVSNPSFRLGNQFDFPPIPTLLLPDTVPEREPIPEIELAVGAMSNYIVEEAARVPAFEAERFEVTNAEYAAFVAAGGYSDARFWPELAEDMAAEGETLEAGLARLADSTGRPGPSTWELGAFAPGTASHPVAGISWYEAMAYARFREASLPTLHHWSAMAFPLYASQIGPYSNINATGLKPVGAQGVAGVNGTYDTYGNVREWVYNAAGDRRWILGGGWSDPAYMANQTFALPPMNRSELNGMRLVYLGDDVPESFYAPRETGDFDYRGRKPISGEAFDLIAEGFVDRGPRELDARIVHERDEGDWIRQRVSITSDISDERLDMLLFLPKTPGPHQVIVYFPPIDVFQYAQDFDTFELGRRFIPLEFVPRSGRAFVWPIFWGSGDRYFGLREMESSRRSALQLEMRQRWYADAKRTIDYLETRDDMNTEALGYMGFSFGASQMVPVLAFEKRFKAAVLIAGGLGELLVEELPASADTLNYLPHIELPVLMLAGRNDFVFPLEASQQPMFEALGTPAEHKRHVLYGGDHNRYPRIELIRDTADWFDRYLGPVQR